MNKQPKVYLQTDIKWKNVDYSAPGESTTIGASGCGPTAAAMLIETLTGETYTPVDACTWSLKHGYKALKQGTYYSYFKSQFSVFGIECRQLNSVSAYGNPNASVHAEAFSLLQQGYYLIACMGKGLWTSSGHFIVAWWEDGKVRINDPASTRQERLNGDIWTFKSQVKYYWAIDAREFNKEDDDMTGKEIVEALTPEQCLAIVREARTQLQDNDSSAYSQEAREFVIEKGIMVGGGVGPDGQPNYMWEDLLTREQEAIIAKRTYDVIMADVRKLLRLA